jgi:hypothetical protein
MRILLGNLVLNADIRMINKRLFIRRDYVTSKGSGHIVPNIVFRHLVALIYHLFHTIYFRLQCNLLLPPFFLTKCRCANPNKETSDHVFGMN